MWFSESMSNCSGGRRVQKNKEDLLLNPCFAFNLGIKSDQTSQIVSLNGDLQNHSVMFGH